jgi:hypothetical protein
MVVLSLLRMLLLIAVASALVGAVSGLLAVRWWVMRLNSDLLAHAPGPIDPFVSAEIDQAAAAWAKTHGRPGAAGVMADKLHLLYDLGRRRQR